MGRVVLVLLATVLSEGCSGAGAGACPAAAAGLGPIALELRGNALFFLAGEGRDVPLAVMHGVRRYEVGDVDRDGRDELVVLWAPVEPPGPARIWVLRPAENGIEYVWRGSSMSGDVEDFTLAATGNAACLVTLERGVDAAFSVAYAWTGFGFAGNAVPVAPEAMSGWTVRCEDAALDCQVAAECACMSCRPQ